MKARTLIILEKVKSGETTLFEAQNELFKLFGVSGTYKSGAKVKITNCPINEHDFELGEVVKIWGKAAKEDYWICVNKNGKECYVNERDCYPIE